MVESYSKFMRSAAAAAAAASKWSKCDVQHGCIKLPGIVSGNRSSMFESVLLRVYSLHMYINTISTSGLGNSSLYKNIKKNQPILVRVL